MKRKIHKVVSVVPMTRQEAEIKVNRTITNLVYGDEGYLVSGNKWLPKSVLERNSVAFETENDKSQYYLNEMRRMREWLKNSPKRHSRPIIKQIINLLTTCLDYEQD